MVVMYVILMQKHIRTQGLNVSYKTKKWKPYCYRALTPETSFISVYEDLQDINIFNLFNINFKLYVASPIQNPVS